MIGASRLPEREVACPLWVVPSLKMLPEKKSVCVGGGQIPRLWLGLGQWHPRQAELATRRGADDVARQADPDRPAPPACKARDGVPSGVGYSARAHAKPSCAKGLTGREPPHGRAPTAVDWTPAHSTALRGTPGGVLRVLTVLNGSATTAGAALHWHAEALLAGH